jgi:DNA-binding CsgD family transcriptional regulator
MLYQSAHFCIDYRPKDRLVLPHWTGTAMTAEGFMGEMKHYMQLLEKLDADKVLWDHTHFHFHIPDDLYGWIEEVVNLPAKAMGMKRIGFILGEDVMAQFSTMDCFEATHSVYTPHYFADPAKALNWIRTREVVEVNPFEKEISLLIEKNKEGGKAKIQVEVSLELLPYYLKGLKELFSHQSFVHQNYQRYMLLTPREKEILGLVIEGYSSKAIAGRLFTSVHTVTTHRKHLLRKLGCRNMANLVKYKVFLQL